MSKSLNVLKSIHSGSSVQIGEDELFHEIMHFNNIVACKLEEWKISNTEVDKKWSDIFNAQKMGLFSLKNIEVLVCFALAVPGTNAVVEIIFSIMNSLWTDEKNRFITETVKAIIILKTHFQDVGCKEIYTIY